MNWDQVKGGWKELKGAGVLQRRYGYTKEQAKRELNDFERTFEES